MNENQTLTIYPNGKEIGRFENGIPIHAVHRPSRNLDIKDISIPMSQLKEGIKHDSEKPKMHLLNPDWLQEVAKVLTVGAIKYSENNYKNGLSVNRILSSAYRHLTAFHMGEDLDPEDGLSHLDHLACCIMMLSWMVKNKPDFDDRVFKQ